ncbi:hypothetical protein [Streptomyces sp. Da 82-17]|uniref:hypothetical protein n=1 Tax=Streptomyces sp. Da 82-17 TaxID=3377116 RepID=UPI0038D3D49C
MRLRRTPVILAAWFAVGGAWLGLAEWPVETPTANGHAADGPIRLDDGRRVLVEFTDRGLVERHRPADGGPWSRPRVLHPKPGDADCSVELSAYGDTVAVMADWDQGCHGPAAATAIAAVSDGDLTDWDVEAIDGIDGWEWTRFSWSGYRVAFRKTGEGVEELNWRESIGFTGP